MVWTCLTQANNNASKGNLSAQVGDPARKRRRVAINGSNKDRFEEVQLKKWPRIDQNGERKSTAEHNIVWTRL